MKPSIAKRSVGSPLIVSAATTADGPGAVVTRETGIGDRRHDAGPGVADPWRAGVTDHDDGLAARDLRDDLTRTSTPRCVRAARAGAR